VSDAPSVTLRPASGEPITLPLALPASHAVRYEITYAVTESEARAVACALGVCSVRLGHKVGRYRYDVLDYGGRVIDYLTGLGVPYLDVLSAGRVAWRLVSEGLLPGEKEVSEREAHFPGSPRED
jgi:hypothetical protein